MRQFLATFTLAASALAASIDTAYNSRVSAGSITTNFQFGAEAEIEQGVTRPNGKFLFTVPSPSAQVWQIDPSANNGSAALTASFNATSVLGITQVSWDVFAVVTGNLSTASGSLSGVPGTCAVYQLDFSGGSQPRITTVARVAQAKALNKITTLNQNTLLASDSIAGQVYAIDRNSGASKVVLSDATTMSPNPAVFPFGVNGVQFINGYLYYTNSGRGLFSRVKLNWDGTATGAYQIVANVSGTTKLPDAFTVLPSCQTFLAGSNQILYIDPSGHFSVLAGSVNSTQLAGATSAEFGVGSAAHTLYVTTSGKASAPATSGFIEPGKVVSIPISGL